MPQSLTGASEVPKIAWEYWGWISFMAKHPGLYGLDEKRAECHDRLCKHYGISKDESKTITDNLNKYEDAATMHFALVNCKNRFTPDINVKENFKWDDREPNLQEEYRDLKTKKGDC